MLCVRFIHSKTAATGPLPIERASKTELVSILSVYQSNSNTCIHAMEADISQTINNLSEFHVDFLNI